MTMRNIANVYEPVVAAKQGPPPLVINIVTTPRTMEFVGGVPASATKTESYVMFSALPQELQTRVKLAIEALQTAI